MRSRRLLVTLTMVTLFVPLLARPLAAQETTCPIDGFTGETLQIMAPASPGGGWDTTSREMQRVLQEAGTVPTVEVYNVPGAGGTVGLAQFANDAKGDEHQLMMMGLVMVGAIATNQSAVTLDGVTPIARLTTEYEVIVVPANSEFQTLADLIAAFQANPTAISWGGGSAGGTDHILVGLLAKATGVDPTQVNYVPYSGGGEALAAILGGQVSAGVSGVGEWKDQIASGELRALAVSGAAAATDAATPAPAVAQTLKEQGVDLELANWRGVVAPPEISAEAKQCLIATVEQMHNSEGWRAVLAQYGWQDYFLPGDEFGAFLASERDRVNVILKELGLVA